MSLTGKKKCFDPVNHINGIWFVFYLKYSELELSERKVTDVKHSYEDKAN